MKSLYNEWERYPAAWLRNLIAAGELARGDVDERSICDLRATDIVGRVQFHGFAGIGGWSHALRLAGWPDDREVWTASCPCQPFSDAGRGRGVDDERHLWPVVFDLVRECRPSVLFGEQVASRAGLEWFAAVRADLEGAGYAVGAADLCAAGVGAPHIRQRLYFVGVRLADGDLQRCDGLGLRLLAGRPLADRAQAAGRGEVGHGLADGDGAGLAGRPDGGSGRPTAERGGGGDDRMADAVRAGRSEWRAVAGDRSSARGSVDGGRMGHADCDAAGRDGRSLPRPEAAGGHQPDDHGSRDAGRVRGHWSDAECLACSDGKARPAQPGVHPLADGVPARVGQLRAAGNAIVPQVAAEFIRAVTPWIDAVQARAA